MKLFKVALVSTGVGALIVAIGSLTAAFTTSEEGQNKFSKALKAIGTVVGNIIDVFADFGDKIVSAIQKPEEAWNSFTGALERGYNFIKEQIIDRFSASWTLFSGRFQKGILAMRIAWNEFTGDSEEAQKLTDELIELDKEMKNASETLAKSNQEVAEIVVGGYNKMTKAVSGFIAEQQREIKISNRIADQRAQADKIERKNTVDRAKANREIAELRFKAEQREKFSASERIKFLTEASKLEEKITNQEIEAARLRFESKKAENQLARSTKEDLDEQADLEAKLIELETSKLNMQKRLQTAITTARNEEKAAAQERIREQMEAAAARRQAELEEIERLKKVLEKESNLAKQQAELTVLLDRELELIKQMPVATEAEVIARDKKIDAVNREIQALNELKQERLEMESFAEDNELIEFEQRTADLSILAQAREDSLTEIEKLGQEARLEGVKQNNELLAQLEEEDRLAAEQREKLKYDAVFTSLSAISTLTNAFAGKSEKEQKRAFNINKGVSIAETLVRTYQSAQAAYLSQLSIPTPDAPIRGAVAAGIATAAGLANVAAIASQKFKSPSKQSPSSGGGGGGGGAVGGTSPSQAPQFNVVGQSGFNQIATALNDQQPVQAFVVAQDVTTAQELDNNIISSATIGG